MASERESDVRDTVNWGRKWLVDVISGKTQLVSFDRSNNIGAINGKMDGSVLEEKSSFKMPGLTFSRKLDWGSYYLYCLQENRSLDSFYEVSFSWGCFVSINLPYGHTWNTVVMSRLVLLVASWNC